jgi:hypothetical protein
MISDILGLLVIKSITVVKPGVLFDLDFTKSSSTLSICLPLFLIVLIKFLISNKVNCDFIFNFFLILIL